MAGGISNSPTSSGLPSSAPAAGSGPSVTLDMISVEADSGGALPGDGSYGDPISGFHQINQQFADGQRAFSETTANRSNEINAQFQAQNEARSAQFQAWAEADIARMNDQRAAMSAAPPITGPLLPPNFARTAAPPTETPTLPPQGNPPGTPLMTNAFPFNPTLPFTAPPAQPPAIPFAPGYDSALYASTIPGGPEPAFAEPSPAPPVVADTNPFSTNNMRRDAMTAGDQLRSFTNLDYPFFKTQGEYFGGQAGSALGKALGGLLPVPGSSFVGGMAGSSLGSYLGGRIDPPQPVPAETTVPTPAP